MKPSLSSDVKGAIGGAGKDLGLNLRMVDQVHRAPKSERSEGGENG